MHVWLQADGQAQRVSGLKKNGSCVCAVDSTLWSFPAVKYEDVLQQVDSCGDSLNTLQQQVRNKINLHHCTSGCIQSQFHLWLDGLHGYIRTWTCNPENTFSHQETGVFVCVSLQLKLSSERLPHIQAVVKNMTARLEPYQFLHHEGLYSALSLRLLGQELSQLETDVDAIHSQLNSAQTQKLSKEVQQNMQWSHLMMIRHVFKQQ